MCKCYKEPYTQWHRVIWMHSYYHQGQTCSNVTADRRNFNNLTFSQKEVRPLIQAQTFWSLIQAQTFWASWWSLNKGKFKMAKLHPCFSCQTYENSFAPHNDKKIHLLQKIITVCMWIFNITGSNIINIFLSIN